MYAEVSRSCPGLLTCLARFSYLAGGMNIKTLRLTDLFCQLGADFRFYLQANPHQGYMAILFDRHFWVCANYRIGYYACRLKVPVFGAIAKLLYVLLNLFVSSVTSTAIRSGAVIGQRFYVHTINTILVTNGAVIGDDCTISSGVCIANKANGRNEGQPRIGNKVTLGLGCKILGNVTIGDNVIVGANAVVIRDVPSNHMAVGVPAVNKPLRTVPERLSASLREAISINRPLPFAGETEVAN